ncbi:TniQ family protein [Paracoccus fistulariae]|uniref:TniQ family protein n=1 Tax=Paracoccus fistulariae TaxID=658446 RepID=A0ABY7SMI1_9RHOB|nr:TniQ family protein [Paracoccus fistulariae]MDB6180021.1 TniQ family protein [Paracoccus fistulariae]WCR08110.1 TniQ family protein [Paracoccus fistulariae]
MAQLFPHLPFHEDETPVSWVARLSALHGCPSLRSFLSDQGIRPSDLLHGARQVVERLCEVTGQDPEPVWRNTASSQGKEVYMLRGEIIPASMLVREETRFCPLCLHEDDAGHGHPGIARRDRLAWSLRVVTTCPRHKLALILRAREHRENMLHKLHLHVPERGKELVALARDAAHRDPSPLQTYVLNRLEGRIGPDWLDSQSLEQAVKATQMLGMTFAFGAGIRLGSIDRDGWDLAGRMGWDWVAQGEPGLRSAFRALQDAAFAQGRGGQNYFTVFGQIHHWLLEPGDRSDHGPVKQVLRDYIIQNMDVCVGRDLLGQPVERRCKYSVQSLALETGLHRQTLCKVLVARGLIAAADAEKGNAILLVDADDGLATAAALTSSVSQAQLRPLLKATLPTVTCLIDLGQLTPLHRSVGENTRDKCGYDIEEVNRLIKRVHDLAPETANLPSDWVTLTQCTKRGRIPMRQLLAMILQGRIRGIGRAPGGAGFKALRIDLEEMRRLPD